MTKGASTAKYVGQIDVFVCPHGCKPWNAHVVVANCYEHAEGGREIVCTECNKTIAYVMKEENNGTDKNVD